MHLKSIVYLFFIFSVSLVAQDLTLSGKVVDVNNIPIPYTNVVVSINKDSTIVNGTTTDDNGFFRIEKLKKGNYILKISYLGFREYTKTIDLSSNTNLGTIILEETAQELDGVLVVVKRPTVKRLVDRLVFNVENSTLSNSNVLDVLKHTPSVLVIDDKITIKGGESTIYINDKKVHLSANEVSQLLEGTSATSIKSIEVITNPPATYEAEGGSVINIVTIKNIIAGYNGSVFGDYKQGAYFPKYSFGTSHFFKTKNISSYINYNVSPKKNYSSKNEYINFINNDQISSSWKTDYSKIEKTSNQNINASIDYELDSNNNINFSTNILLSPRNNSKSYSNSITEVFDSNKNLDSIFNSLNSLVEETINFAYTLTYTHKFSKAGEKLSISSHHTDYDFSSFQNVDTGYFLPNDNNSFRDNKFQTFSNQKIKIYTAQLDYELPINDASQFETGLKVSDINSKSILNQYIYENDIKTEDLKNSDVFLYNETNYAAYTSFSKDWEKWSLKSGLRFEYTDLKGNSISINQVNNKDYIKFFPSFYVLHKMNDKNELYFNYKKRIYRPNYNELNPFKYYLTDNSYISGDPNLKPQIDDVFTLGYTFNKKYTLELYYRYEKDPTLEIVFQDNDNNILKYINTNIKRSVFYSLDFTTSSQIVNNWNLYLLTSVFYYENQFFALESNNELKTIDKWSVYANVGNYFSFLKDESLAMDISLLYISPLADGPSILSDRFNLDINVRKHFWKNKASLSVGVIDVFNTKNYTLRTKYLNQDALLQSRFENRLFTLGFNYKFGNDKLSVHNKNTDLDERNRLNNNRNNNGDN